MTTGTLRICATPIGNLGDVSPRLRETLAASAVVACEDTRRTRALLAALASARRSSSASTRTPRRAAQRSSSSAGARRRRRARDRCRHARRVRSRPRLVAAAHAAGVASRCRRPVRLTAAIAGAGIEGERVAFIGFLPRSAGGPHGPPRRGRRVGRPARSRSRHPAGSRRPSRASRRAIPSAPSPSAASSRSCTRRRCAARPPRSRRAHASRRAARWRRARRRRRRRDAHRGRGGRRRRRRCATRGAARRRASARATPRGSSGGSPALTATAQLCARAAALGRGNWRSPPTAAAASREGIAHRYRACEPLPVTTPIYYVNARPAPRPRVHDDRRRRRRAAHAPARRGRLLPHGHRRARLQRRAQRAAEEGITPQEFVDRSSRRLPPAARATSTPRTTSSSAPRTRSTRRFVQGFLERLRASGRRLRGHLRGPLLRRLRGVLPRERAGRRARARSTARRRSGSRRRTGSSGCRPSRSRCSRTTTRSPSSSCPRSRYNEARSFIEAGLDDVSLSRASIEWGMPRAVGPRADDLRLVRRAASTTRRRSRTRGPGEDLTDRYWPARWQLLAKDILKFHAVIWPAMLLAPATRCRSSC